MKMRVVSARETAGFAAILLEGLPAILLEGLPAILMEGLKPLPVLGFSGSDQSI
jgi:hypothetical protein